VFAWANPWTTSMSTNRSRKRTPRRFQAEAHPVQHADGSVGARWTPETATTYDPAFEGWAVERFVCDWPPSWGTIQQPVEHRAVWVGFPARLTRPDVTVILHEDGRSEVAPASATLEPHVLRTIRGIVYGTSVGGSTSGLDDLRERIRAAIRSTLTKHPGEWPTREQIASQIGGFDGAGELSSSFKRAVRSQGWDPIVESEGRKLGQGPLKRS
jgi:hypothetical protein